MFWACCVRFLTSKSSCSPLVCFCPHHLGFTALVTVKNKPWVSINTHLFVVLASGLLQKFSASDTFHLVEILFSLDFHNCPSNPSCLASLSVVSCSLTFLFLVSLGPGLKSSALSIHCLSEQCSFFPGCGQRSRRSSLQNSLFGAHTCLVKL